MELAYRACSAWKFFAVDNQEMGKRLLLVVVCGHNSSAITCNCQFVNVLISAFSTSSSSFFSHWRPANTWSARGHPPWHCICHSTGHFLHHTYMTIYLIWSGIFSPPARWGLLDLSSSSSTSCPLPPPPPPPVSPRPCLHQLPPALPPCQLFAKLFANSLRRLSAPSSLPTSQLSVHRWTSTWDLPSSVCTAGPQPGTCPAQCAPLDLNLGPAQLSVHHWTPTAR